MGTLDGLVTLYPEYLTSNPSHRLDVLFNNLTSPNVIAAYFSVHWQSTLTRLCETQTELHEYPLMEGGKAERHSYLIQPPHSPGLPRIQVALIEFHVRHSLKASENSTYAVIQTYEALMGNRTDWLGKGDDPNNKRVRRLNTLGQRLQNIQAVKLFNGAKILCESLGYFPIVMYDEVRRQAVLTGHLQMVEHIPEEKRRVVGAQRPVDGYHK